jgi:hypothetical protein
MKEVTLKIPDNSFPFFMELVQKLGFEVAKNKDWYDLLSKEEKKAIDKGLKDAKNGNTIPHEQVMQSVKAKINQLKNR